MDSRGANNLLHDREALLICETSQGLELRASLVRLTRPQAVFEIYHTQFALRNSEGLIKVKILLGETPVFSGRPVISSLINTGSILICEVELGEGWMDFDVLSLSTDAQGLPTRYK